MSMWKLRLCYSFFFYLQYKRLLIDSQCVEQSELVLTGEVLHLHTAHISYLKVAAHDSIQQPLRWAAQHWRNQTLRTEVSKYCSSLFRILHNCSCTVVHKPSETLLLAQGRCSWRDSCLGLSCTNIIAIVSILNVNSVGITFHEKLLWEIQ